MDSRVKRIIQVNLLHKLFQGYERYPTSALSYFQMGGGFPGFGFWLFELGGRPGKNEIIRCCVVRVLGFCDAVLTGLVVLWFCLSGPVDCGSRA